METNQCRICFATPLTSNNIKLEHNLSKLKGDQTIKSLFESISGGQFSVEAHHPQFFCLGCVAKMLQAQELLDQIATAEEAIRLVIKKEQEETIVEYTDLEMLDEDYVSRNDEKQKLDLKYHGMMSMDCPECSESFAEIAYRNEHLQIVHGYLYCRICFGIYERNVLDDHVEFYHTGVQRKAKKGQFATCEMCNKMMLDTIATMRYHIETHTGVSWDALPFACHLCAQRFVTETRLQLHTLARHGIMACPLCNLPVNVAKMYAHMLRFHEQRKTYIPPQIVNFAVEWKQAQYLRSAEYQRAAKMCGLCQENVISLGEHLKLFHWHTLFTCPDCPFETQNCSKLRNHRFLQHSERAADRLICAHCNRTYPRYKLANHIRAVHGIGLKWHICHLCSDKFTYSSSLKRHLRSHKARDSAAVPSFECNECGKIFRTPEAVVSHKRNIHSGKKFQCEHCSKILKSASTFRVHLRSHKAKSYKCPRCPKFYASNQNLRLHMEKAHPDFPMPPKGTIMATLKNRNSISFKEKFSKSKLSSYLFREMPVIDDSVPDLSEEVIC